MDKQEPKTVTARLSPEAVRWAKIASGYTDETVSEYLTRIVIETAQRDAERLHAEALRDQPTPPPARPRKGRPS